MDPDSCFIMEQFTNDSFKRLFPKPAGNAPTAAMSNNVKVKDDLIG